MRYVPSPDQIAYLERIGVKDFCAGLPVRRANPTRRAPTKVPAGLGRVHHRHRATAARAPIRIGSAPPKRKSTGWLSWLFQDLF